MGLKIQLNRIDLERLILVPVFIFLILIYGTGVHSYLMEHPFSHVISILHIVHKGLMICFYFLVIALFFRRSQARATTSSLLARTLAYVGTFTPFILIFTRSSETTITLSLYSMSVMICGMLFAIYSLMTLGRSFGIMPQARAIVRSGPYRLIKHPLYVGEIVVFGGAILTGFTIAKLWILLLFASIQSYRAVQEEKVLDETIPEYSVYRVTTKRFIPGVI
jgi:protein-S-isoprenylcysteine O-methyltransferase Ste14